MRRLLLTLLALVGVGCALVVTASSTIAQAAEAGMTGKVPLALVGLLEVVNVAGTWTWITDPRPRVRLEAALGVAAASSVTAVCGARVEVARSSVEVARPDEVLVEDVAPAAEDVAEPVRLDRQHVRRRPHVAATSTAEGRAEPAADRAA